MKLFLFIIAAFLGLQASNAQTNTIDYFGQTLPGNVPQLFAPGSVSGTGYVNTLSFSADGENMVFTKWIGGTTPKLFYSKYENKVWTAPAQLNFTGMNEMEGIFAPYGNQLYFAAGTMAGSKWSPDDLWKVENQSGSWTTAVKVNELNTNDYEFFCTQTLDTTIYFQRSTDNLGSIYYSKFRNGIFTTPVKMDSPINLSTRWSFHPCISPDGSYLIIELGNNSNNDLWVSFRNNNKWSELKSLGNKINTLGSEGKPTLSPDGKFLFFSRQTSSSSDIYWVSTKVIDSLKQTITGMPAEKTNMPTGYKLFQNYPNPFNPSTVISYRLPVSGNVKLKIYDTLGREVMTLVDSIQSAGEHSITWKATDNKNNALSSGIYFCKMESNGMSLHKKMLLIR